MLWILKLNHFSFLSSHDESTTLQCSPLFQSKPMRCCWVCLKNSPAPNPLGRERCPREMQTLSLQLIGWLHIGVLHRSLELQLKHGYYSSLLLPGERSRSSLKCHLLMLLQGSEELGIAVVVIEFFGLEDIAWPPVKGHQKCRALYNNCIYFSACL